MKNQLNEVKRMQQLAGIITESQLLNENVISNDITDFCNTYFKELEQKFGEIPTEFEPDTLLDGIEITYAGTDEEDGITISFDPEYMKNYKDDYNDIEKVEIAGKTIYVNDYLNSNESLNEGRRMQQLAGILVESQLNEEIKYDDLKQAIEGEFGDIIGDHYFTSGDNFLTISYDAADYYDKSPEFFARKIRNIIKSNPELKSKYKELRPAKDEDWFTDEDYIKYPFLDPDKNDNAPSEDEDLIFVITK